MQVNGREGSVVVSAAYSIKQTREALNPEVRNSKPKEKPTSVTLIPYVQAAYIRLSRMLAKQNIRSVRLLLRKISSLLHPVKDDLGLRTPEVYSIPCKCSQVYIGQWLIYTDQNKRTPCVHMAWTSRQIGSGLT